MPRKHRRVRTEPVPGSDPEPGVNNVLGNKETEITSIEDAPKTNELPRRLAELKEQKPPHYS